MPLCVFEKKEKNCLFISWKTNRWKTEENFPEPTSEWKKQKAKTCWCEIRNFTWRQLPRNFDLSSWMSRYATPESFFHNANVGSVKSLSQLNTAAWLFVPPKFWYTTTNTSEEKSIWVSLIKGIVLGRFWLKNSLWKVTLGCYSSLANLKVSENLSESETNLGESAIKIFESYYFRSELFSLKENRLKLFLLGFFYLIFNCYVSWGEAWKFIDVANCYCYRLEKS